MPRDDDEIIHLYRSPAEGFEDVRPARYDDSLGNPTIGIGHCIQKGETGFDGLLSSERISELFYRDAQSALNELRKKFPNFDTYPNSGKLGLLDMMFNMGPAECDKDGNPRKWGTFPKLKEAVKAQDWVRVAQECHRGEIQESRNTQTKNWFLMAEQEKAPTPPSASFGEQTKSTSSGSRTQEPMTVGTSHETPERFGTQSASADTHQENTATPPPIISPSSSTADVKGASAPSSTDQLPSQSKSATSSASEIPPQHIPQRERQKAKPQTPDDVFGSSKDIPTIPIDFSKLRPSSSCYRIESPSYQQIPSIFDGFSVGGTPRHPSIRYETSNMKAAGIFAGVIVVAVAVPWVYKKVKHRFFTDPKTRSSRDFHRALKHYAENKSEKTLDKVIKHAKDCAEQNATDTGMVQSCRLIEYSATHADSTGCNLLDKSTDGEGFHLDRMNASYYEHIQDLSTQYNAAVSRKDLISAERISNEVFYHIPNSPEAHLIRADILGRMHHFSEAHQELTESARLTQTMQVDTSRLDPFSAGDRQNALRCQKDSLMNSNQQAKIDLLVMEASCSTGEHQQNCLKQVAQHAEIYAVQHGDNLTAQRRAMVFFSNAQMHDEASHVFDRITSNKNFSLQDKVTVVLEGLDHGQSEQKTLNLLMRVSTNAHESMDGILDMTLRGGPFNDKQRTIYKQYYADKSPAVQQAANEKIAKISSEHADRYPENIEYQRIAAADLSTAGQKTGAIQKLERVVISDHCTADDHVSLVTLYKETNQNKKAATACRQYTTRYPDASNVQVMRRTSADLFMKENLLVEATEVLESADTSLESTQLRRSLVDALTQKQMLKKAIRVSEKIARSETCEPRDVKRLGDLYQATHQNQKAIIYYDQYIASNPSAPDVNDVRRTTVALLRQENQAAAAISRLEEVNRSHNCTPQDVRELGELYRETNQNQKAIDCFKAYLNRAASDAADINQVKRSLFDLHVSENQLIEARQVLNTLELTQETIYLRRGLATLFDEQHQPLEAISLLEEITQSAFTEPQDIWFLANFYEQTQQDQKAIDCLEKYLTAKPDETKARKQIVNLLCKDDSPEAQKRAFEHQKVICEQEETHENLDALFKLVVKCQCFDQKSKDIFKRYFQQNPDDIGLAGNYLHLLKSQKDCEKDIDEFLTDGFNTATDEETKYFYKREARVYLTERLLETGQQAAGLGVQAFGAFGIGRIVGDIVFDTVGKEGLRRVRYSAAERRLISEQEKMEQVGYCFDQAIGFQTGSLDRQKIVAFAKAHPERQRILLPEIRSAVELTVASMEGEEVRDEDTLLPASMRDRHSVSEMRRLVRKTYLTNDSMQKFLIACNRALHHSTDQFLSEEELETFFADEHNQERYKRLYKHFCHARLILHPAPKKLDAYCQGMTDQYIDTYYGQGGWFVHQRGIGTSMIDLVAQMPAVNKPIAIYEGCPIQIIAEDAVIDVNHQQHGGISVRACNNNAGYLFYYGQKVYYIGNLGRISYPKDAIKIGEDIFPTPLDNVLPHLFPDLAQQNKLTKQAFSTLFSWLTRSGSYPSVYCTAGTGQPTRVGYNGRSHFVNVDEQVSSLPFYYQLITTGGAILKSGSLQGAAIAILRPFVLPVTQYVEQKTGIPYLTQAVDWGMWVIDVTGNPVFYFASKIGQCAGTYIANEIIKNFEIQDPNIQAAIRLLVSETASMASSAVASRIQKSVDDCRTELDKEEQKAKEKQGTKEEPKSNGDVQKAAETIPPQTGKIQTLTKGTCRLIARGEKCRDGVAKWALGKLPIDLKKAQERLERQQKSLKETIGTGIERCPSAVRGAAIKTRTTVKFFVEHKKVTLGVIGLIGAATTTLPKGYRQYCHDTQLLEAAKAHKAAELQEEQSSAADLAGSRTANSPAFFAQKPARHRRVSEGTPMQPAATVR